MAEPYTIRILVPDGDPEGAKIIELLNWTGIGVAFPRARWPHLNGRPEFSRSGVYILVGTAEGTTDDLQTVYVGQGEVIGDRLNCHYDNKEFWDWGYGFVSKGDTLNRAHITWLEHALLKLAKAANRCHLDNGNFPKEPGLSEADLADTNGFLREMLRILPLVGLRIFEKPQPVIMAPSTDSVVPPFTTSAAPRDTMVVPAVEPGFSEVFLGENCWYAVRIGGGMLPKIKYIAAYQSSPISAITHYAQVKCIEPYGDEGKFRVVFVESAKPLSNPIPFADATAGSMQSVRYTSFAKLLTATKVSELFAPVSIDQKP